MLELNKLYEAQFLGQQMLTGAVTSDLLCQLVHGLPTTLTSIENDRVQCTIQCNASGLTVIENNPDGSGSVRLSVQLGDILFCHVDKGQSEVIVWVVRAKEDDYNVINGNQPILQAYIYKCLNSSDAVGLFKVYNEINRQAKFDKYRKNGEKKEEVVVRPNQLPATDLDAKDNIEECNDNAAIVPDLTTTNVKTEVNKLNKLANSGSKSPQVHQRSRTNRNGNISPTWSSIAGNIANYRNSFKILRPRDKEVHEALLSELRERLRNRDCKVDVIDRDGPIKSKPESRQRKPAKMIGETKMETTKTPPATTLPTTKQPSFQFPWSNAVKKLVHKKRNNGYVMTSTSRPSPLPIPESHTPVWYIPANDVTSSKSKLPKKSPTMIPPAGRSTGNNSDPYFYLPPLPMIHEVNSSHKSRTDVYLPGWIHPQSRCAKNGKSVTVSNPSFKILGVGSDDRKHYSYPTIQRYCNGSHHYQYGNGIGNGSNKVIYSIGRFARTNQTKKRTPSGLNGGTTFYRTSSTGSRGSTSSESGPDNRLRSVMKKPKQTNENTPPEQKKNVTFHAYATVQVLN